MDPTSLNSIMFNLDNFKTRLSHNLAFEIHTTVRGKSIHRTLIDEGASTCVMSLSCWRAISSPEINQSSTTLKDFDGRNFKPHGILNSCALELEGKTISIDIEVIGATLDYNLLLRHSWFYAMTAVASSIFRVIEIPHLGKIVTIDQLDFCTPDLRGDHPNNIMFVGGSKSPY